MVIWKHREELKLAKVIVKILTMIIVEMKMLMEGLLAVELMMMERRRQKGTMGMTMKMMIEATMKEKKKVKRTQRLKMVRLKMTRMARKRIRRR